MMNFSTDNLRTVFADDNKFDKFEKLCFDLVQGNPMYDVDDNGNQVVVSKRDANKAIQKVFMDICGLSEEDLKSKKKRKRAEQAHAVEVFEVIENVIDFKIEAGWKESEFFNNFVEVHNVALGDAEEFRTEMPTLFVVSDYSGDNHDLTMQQYPEGKVIPVKATPKYIKTGKDIDLIILGRVDFDKWVSRIAESYVQYTQKLAYDALLSVQNTLPSAYKGSGALSASTKDNFDALIEQVEAINGATAVIMGTKVALKKITAIANVQWASEDQKKSIADTGRLGNYEGTILIEIEQRLSLADGVTRMIDNDLLWIFPTVEDKFIKMVDGGETTLEIDEKGRLQDDFETIEVARDLGVGVALGQYMGVWDLNP
jgi:hypothetical protein